MIRRLWSGRIKPIQRPIHRQFPQHDHLRNPQQCMATCPLQMIHQIVGHDIGRSQRLTRMGEMVQEVPGMLVQLAAQISESLV